jgi:hypothetical protein
LKAEAEAKIEGKQISFWAEDRFKNGMIELEKKSAWHQRLYYIMTQVDYSVVEEKASLHNLEGSLVEIRDRTLPQRGSDFKRHMEVLNSCEDSGARFSSMKTLVENLNIERTAIDSARCHLTAERYFRDILISEPEISLSQAENRAFYSAARTKRIQVQCLRKCIEWIQNTILASLGAEEQARKDGLPANCNSKRDKYVGHMNKIGKITDDIYAARQSLQHPSSPLTVFLVTRGMVNMISELEQTYLKLLEAADELMDPAYIGWLGAGSKNLWSRDRDGGVAGAKEDRWGWFTECFKMNATLFGPMIEGVREGTLEALQMRGFGDVMGLAEVPGHAIRAYRLD